MNFLFILLFPFLFSVSSYAQAPPDETKSLLQSLQERLAKLEAAPAKPSLSAFNPAMVLALDTVFRNDSSDKARFQFRAAELNIESPVDPYLKGWAVINGNEGGVEVEEMALQTTSLPWNLTVTGGRLFADFGRLSHFHDDSLPVIDRPRTLDAYMNGESQAQGVEISWLAPTPFYLNATAGVFNQIGAENERTTNDFLRSLDAMTYLGRLNTYAELGDHSLELGGSVAWTPKRYVTDTSVAGTDFNADGTIDTPNDSAGIQTVKNTWRTLSGIDLTYRWQPAGGGLYKEVTWGTEVLMNNERRFNATTNLPTGRVRAWGGYSYIQVKLGRRWRPGAMLDISEDLDRSRSVTKTMTGFLSFYMTEYQRLRLSGARTTNNTPGRMGSNVVALQWTGFLGHHVHGFRDR